MRRLLQQTYIAPIGVAFLLTSGIRALIAAAEGPVSAAVVHVVNFALIRGRLDAIRGTAEVSWDISLFEAIAGVGFLVIGVGFALWMYRTTPDRKTA